MRKNTLNSFLLIASIALGSACAPKKVIITPPDVIATPAAEQPAVSSEIDRRTETLQLLKSKDFTYNTLSLKGKAKLDIDGDENNVNINIRIRNSKEIWVSISAVIGEVARVSITPDSIRIINRLQTTYTKKPFNFIHSFTSKKIDFSVLQDIISGNAIGQFINASLKAEQENGVWVLSGENEDLAYRFLFNTLLRVQETNLNDVKAAQALKVVYGDYQNLNGSLFPSSLTINSMSGVKKINIRLDFSSVEGNVALDFPFSVKSRFKVIE